MFWEPENAKAETTKAQLKAMSARYPSVKVKFVNVKKDPTKPTRLGVSQFPTVLLLREGREVDRISGGNTLLEQLFRKAHA